MEEHVLEKPASVETLGHLYCIIQFNLTSPTEILMSLFLIILSGWSDWFSSIGLIYSITMSDTS